ncbi:MAG: veratrol--corrinoid protein metyltransferase [Oscillospiraceae bacterium]|nr:veratrol--corrinoid protein metyltransferase [Oscillospiraceae bacterium]
MTEKENLLMTLRGEIPEWLPRYGIVADPNSKHPPAVLDVTPSLTRGTRGTGAGGFDIWGVEFVATESTGGQALPVPNKYLITDITKWRDVIHAPSLEGVDWEAMARKDLANIDRTQTAVKLGTHVGYFQNLMNFMGFEEGMCAMMEEPEECVALMDYLANFYDEVTRKACEYYKPDILGITDDTATAINPFISVELYREMIKPFHARLGAIAQHYGIEFVDMHDCGRCEDFIDDWLDFGVNMWNPAQVMNDLVGIKKKYAGKLTLIGCWDSSGPAGWTGASEELVRSEVRRVIDTFAPNGNFCFWGSVYGPIDAEDTKNRARWMTEEYDSYGRTWYKTHC